MLGLDHMSRVLDHLCAHCVTYSLTNLDSFLVFHLHILTLEVAGMRALLVVVLSRMMWVVTCML